MDLQKAASPSLQEPEVVLNLWAYAGEDGSVLRLAGKAYVMQGEDREKLALLRQLSVTDFLSARWVAVPKNFKMRRGDEEMVGVANAEMLADPSTHSLLFGPLMDVLEKSMPEQMRCYDGEYVPFRQGLPESPLCVTTVVMECEDGRLVPLVSVGV